MTHAKKPLAGRFVGREYGPNGLDYRHHRNWGLYVEARDRLVRVGVGTRSIICLDAAVRDPDEANLDIDDYEVVDLADGPGNDPRSLYRPVRLVGTLSEQSPKLLVHCRAGRSRSAIVVAGHLMRDQNWSSGKALAFIAAHREIQLTPGIEELLQSLGRPTHHRSSPGS